MRASESTLLDAFVLVWAAGIAAEAHAIAERLLLDPGRSWEAAADAVIGIRVPCLRCTRSHRSIPGRPRPCSGPRTHSGRNNVASNSFPFAFQNHLIQDRVSYNLTSQTSPHFRYTFALRNAFSARQANGEGEPKQRKLRASSSASDRLDGGWKMPPWSSSKLQALIADGVLVE